MDGTKSLEDWEAEYRRLHPSYEAYAEKLRSLICDLLKDKDLTIAQSEARGKEVDSFVGKMTRKGKDYADPLHDITDLAGIRIITYYLEETREVGEIIAKEFDVLEESSKGGDDPDRFGYVSDHYIVQLNDRRKDLGEWNPFKDMVAEIQVRTATQHAWAAVEHRLGYKTAKTLPAELTRRLNRLSALFELADEQFSAVRDENEKLSDQARKTVRGGDLEVSLDVTSLEAYVNESEVVQEAANLIAESGITILTEPNPQWPGRQGRDRFDLIESLNRHGITTLQGLDDLLHDAPKAVERLRGYALAYRELDETDGRAAGYLEDMINVLCFMLWDVEPDEVELVYASPASDALIQALGKA